MYMYVQRQDCFSHTCMSIHLYLTTLQKHTLLKLHLQCSQFTVYTCTVPFNFIITMNYLSEQLDQSGTYQFKVKVSGANQAYGYAFINVTVLPG